jgi:hypothetical protein
VKRIFKYPVPMELIGSNALWNDRFELALPAGAEILSVQAQANMPVVWALVDPEAPVKFRKFLLLNTGGIMPENMDYKYLGTYQLNGGGLVFHLFEKIEVPF